MHKIKEMLHSDDSSSSSSTSHQHQHGGDSNWNEHSHSYSHGEIQKGHLDTREFRNDHIRHGEIEHGHQHHQHHHHGDEHLKYSHGGEKHIYHERETMRSGDMYREGINPTMNREVISECRHDDGTSRARVAEGKIVKETIKEVELHKVQPVIHREREQKEIRHVVEPHQKFEVKDTKVLHREKDIDLGVRREASSLETSRSMGHAPHIESSREYIATERQHQELPMRVEEHIHKNVEEHIHPVVYKEVLKPKVLEETHHLYETVKEKPIETFEVRELHSRGTGLREAERSFFNQEGSRGISIDEKHLHERHLHAGDMKHGHSHSHEHSHKMHDQHLHSSDLKRDHIHGHEHSHKMHDQHLHSNDLKHGHSHGHNHGHQHLGHTETRYVETDRSLGHGHLHNVNVINEPIVGHHQNIGAHHVAGAIPAGHNTAYDAALCNECTGNQICSHGQRDAALMQKMNEKKIVKDKTLSKKEQKKLRKEGDYATADRISHEHVHVV